MQGKHYIMRKLNQEKEAASEGRRKELETKGYTCIGVREPASAGTSPKEAYGEGEEEGKAAVTKSPGKKQKANTTEGLGDRDGKGTDDAGNG